MAFFFFFRKGAFMNIALLLDEVSDKRREGGNKTSEHFEIFSPKFDISDAVVAGRESFPQFSHMFPIRYFCCQIKFHPKTFTTSFCRHCNPKVSRKAQKAQKSIISETLCWRFQRSSKHAFGEKTLSVMSPSAPIPSGAENILKEVIRKNLWSLRSLKIDSALTKRTGWILAKLCEDFVLNECRKG